MTLEEVIEELNTKANRSLENLIDPTSARENLGAVSKTGDTVTGPLNTVNQALKGQTYGGGNTAALHTVILGGDGGDPNREAAVFNPVTEAEWLQHAGTYQTREAVNQYMESAIFDGTLWNITRDVTGYTATSVTLNAAAPSTIKVGAFVRTQHEGQWWDGKISAISPDRLTITCAWGWVKRGQNSTSIPTGTASVWLNFVNKAWIGNWNLIPQPASVLSSGVIMEAGIVNRRGAFVEGFNGNIGLNDFSGFDVVSFGDYQGNFAFRSRGLRNGFLVEGGLGDGTASGFRIKNTQDGAASFNPAWGIDIQQADGIPFIIRPEIGQGTGVYDINARWLTDGSMSLGSHNFQRPVSISMHSKGRDVSDYRITVSDGSLTQANAGQALYQGSSHVFSGPQGHPTLVVSGGIGTAAYVQIDGGSEGGPAAIYAQGSAADVSLLLRPKGAENAFLHAGNGQNRFRWNNDGISFYGVAPIARQSLPLPSSDTALTQAIRAGLINLGLFS